MSEPRKFTVIKPPSTGWEITVEGDCLHYQPHGYVEIRRGVQPVAVIAADGVIVYAHDAVVASGHTC